MPPVHPRYCQLKKVLLLAILLFTEYFLREYLFVLNSIFLNEYPYLSNNRLGLNKRGGITELTFIA